MFRFIFFLFVLCSSFHSQQKWKSIPLADYQWSNNTDDLEYQALIHSDRVIFSKVKVIPKKIPFKVNQKLLDKEYPFEGDLRFFKTKSGYFVSKNSGEWGGVLWFFRSSGKPSYKISDSQVNRFLTIANRIYVLEGLAHLSSSFGRLQELKLVRDRWVIKDIFDFNSSPQTFCKANQYTYVATDLKIFSISEKLEIKELFSSLKSWPDAYPGFCLVKNENIYLSQTGGVLRIDLRSKRATFFQPN